ncbi:nucleotidyltransferase domain-containing protein [Staphylothermus hellenicus]|uniref:DNA polymerase beta domain protein region n=1 Tax=Staphylothermus hellenicus (strain DSM 12710 / JCM 10830 / BK20S6-10-b1 / P8) TaxID=591019 RepID=D7D8D1_STAHD|nr:nucleotidyltransferase domain-containing protein [Staphylothermus hellenicus]ADI32027.1 DNA polymerase beta domain protein region [Staphylothermus hellenicus DSM 12710]
MPRKTLVDLEIERAGEWRKYFEKTFFYLEKIKSIIKKHDPNARVLLFGSYVRGELRPDSDIDVLIITILGRDSSQRMKLRVEIAREIGDVTPFEIHIVSPEEYEEWYKKFIDEYFEV